MSFQNRIAFQKLNDREWQVLYDLFYAADDGRVWCVPAGFVTDDYSVPRFAWWLIPPSGIADESAVLHDWLYRSKVLPRSEADALFLEAMLSQKIAPLRARLIWLGVRLGGHFAWRGRCRT